VEVVTVQNRYNLTDRHSEGVLDACEQAGIGFIPWFPLATGKLATSAQKALAWLLARSQVMLPIPGTSSVEHLEENVAAAQIQLSREELEEIGSASQG
jgi:aryl-alcohol dehydrogenase-like predicted oxidoreductase